MLYQSCRLVGTLHGGSFKRSLPRVTPRVTKFFVEWTLAWVGEKIRRQIKCDYCFELDLLISEMRLYVRRNCRTFYYLRAICHAPCFGQSSTKGKEKTCPLNTFEREVLIIISEPLFFEHYWLYMVFYVTLSEVGNLIPIVKMTKLRLGEFPLTSMRSQNY